MIGMHQHIKNKIGTFGAIALVLIMGLAAPNTWADSQPAPGAVRAVHHGLNFENRIEAGLTSRGFTAVMYSDWVTHPEDFPPDVLLKVVPFTTLYGSKGHTEFVLRSPRLNGAVRIEAKWQQTPGSVDEKLPYLYLNAAHFETMPKAHVVIVIDGEGWRDGALAWLRSAAKTPPPGKRIDVFNLQEFLSWANTL